MEKTRIKKGRDWPIYKKTLDDLTRWKIHLVLWIVMDSQCYIKNANGGHYSHSNVDVNIFGVISFITFAYNKVETAVYLHLHTN